MTVALTLTVDLARTLGGLRRMRAVGEDLRPVLGDIGAELEGSTVKRFTSNVAPDGTPWKQSLRAEKTKKPTLVLRTNLRDSIHFVVEPNAVSIGSNLIYARIHQTGGVIKAKGGSLAFHLYGGAFVRVKSVTMPKREYLGMSANDDQAVVDIVGDHWARAARAGGR
ncbi:phage virion morphogenesis protein [Caulobacter segnis]|uniref:Phage virion morphogenesis protein n=1 Tax=Caulobacter segnis TaxID=88688 RepID=A0A2W5UX91_9CAUL|nr:phage virion morphogenesis protein [Caulobacter segnis]PZR32290.1 MAG: phage virion morphogenesis protein [Caulobacter segnis]